MKKAIVYFLIISMINLIGCYYQEQMIPGEYNFDENSKVKITTKDTTYNLSGKDYYFENDTLFATVSKKIDNQTTLKTNVEIPIENIEIVEVERNDALATVLTTLAVLIGALGLVILIAGANGNFGF